jgi:HPt (histidine-containing phosphotransfer) domain-containing protein
MAQTTQPVDLVHLDRYTGGERAINEEILRLFDATCRESLERLEALYTHSAAHGMPRDWRETAHTLKGAARGIGAFPLADAAAAAEASIDDRRAALEALERMKAHSAAVHAFIADFLAGEP